MTTYPNTPGYKRLGTSSNAAAQMRGRAGTIRTRIMELLNTGHELTPDETADKLGLSVLAVRPRFSELLHDKRIEPTGVTRKNISSKEAEVYRATTTLCGGRNNEKMLAELRAWQKASRL